MVRPTLRVLLLAALTLTAHRISAEEWRGLRPYHSTRADVVKLLGECTDEDEDRYCYYDLSKEEVVINFARSCEKLPNDAVSSIKVKPKQIVSLDHYHFDIPKMRVLRHEMDKPDYVCYIDDNAGVILHTMEGRVEEITYVPSAKDRVRCSLQPLEDFVQTFSVGRINRLVVR